MSKLGVEINLIESINFLISSQKFYLLAKITKTTSSKDSVFGVISDSPGLELNSEAGDSYTHPFVALIGRVNVKFKGTIIKGEYVVASNIPGVSCRWSPEYSTKSIVGISLQDLENNNEITDLKIVIKKSL